MISQHFKHFISTGFATKTKPCHIRTTERINKFTTRNIPFWRVLKENTIDFYDKQFNNTKSRIENNKDVYPDWIHEYFVWNQHIDTQVSNYINPLPPSPPTICKQQ